MMSKTTRTGCCETGDERAARIQRDGRRLRWDQAEQRELTVERRRREMLLREIGAIEGMGRIAETLRRHLEDSMLTILDADLTPDADPLGKVRDLEIALANVLSVLIEATE